MDNKTHKNEGKSAPLKNESAAKIAELTNDLQRMRADFENYRKRVEQEKNSARYAGRMSVISQILPVVDNIDRALANMPKELSGNAWSEGVALLPKNLEKALTNMGVKKINSRPGVMFDPNKHEAVQMDDADGETEVIAEELQAGYMLDDSVLRPAMVKVTRK